MSANDRTPREQETREAEMRPQAWRPPTALPDPHQRPGVRFRWVRTAAAGLPDALNVSNSFQEGWSPVRAVDYPELEIKSDRDSRYPDGVEVGGLLLCCASTALMSQRDAYYAEMTARQMKAVNDQLDREEDPRLRTMTRSHQTTVGFGPEARREPRG